MRYQRRLPSQEKPANTSLSLLLLGTLTLPFASAAALASEQSGETQFDVRALEARGVDPQIGDWFRQAPRFMPGESTVKLSVNGSARGKVKARFANDGRLCADQNFQKDAGLLSPPGFSQDDACFDLKTAWPQTELYLDPSEVRVDLVIPAQAVAAPGTESGNWHHGGFAGMLNYDAQYMDSAGDTAGVNFMQLGTETGFNLGNWIVRSRQTLSRLNGENTLQHQAAYAQRSFTESKKVLQTGQISLSNSMFGTGQVLGFQVFPEAALQGNQGGPGLVEGIADSQSIIEVRQSGALVYSTTVPAGPFSLQGFSLLNTRSDLNVTLIGSSGEKREFTVPASSLLRNGIAVAPGLSFGMGKLEQQGSSEAPMLGTLANGWVLTPHTTLNAGLLGSSPYQAGALGLDSQIFDATVLSLQATAAQDNKHGSKGVFGSASLSHNLTDRLNVHVNLTQQTEGYRELSDALQNDDWITNQRSRNQIGGGIGWSEETLGSLSLSWSRGTTFADDTTNYLRFGWSRSFGRTYVGASLEHDSGAQGRDSDSRFYVTVNIPFGSERSVSSYVNSANSGTRFGAKYSDRSSQDRGWSLSSERDVRNQRTSSTASMDMLTPFSQLSGSVSHYSDNYTSWTARSSGAVVAHDDGITLSPYRVQDTFGIAKVGDEGGVRMDTPAGPTWTDGDGYAVLPSLGGYRRSAIQVDTRSLAKNVDIGNAWQETEAARGSVSYVNFDVVRTRRVLVSVQDSQAEPLPRGASVFDEEEQFVTVVGAQGAVFIPDVGTHRQFKVQVSDKILCAFNLTLPDKAESDGLYETASTVCR